MVKTKKNENLPENNAIGMFLLHNDVKIMKISKKFRGVNFWVFFRAHFSDFFTTSTNRCILPISYSSVQFSLYISIYVKKTFSNFNYPRIKTFYSRLSKEVYFQEK
jgi:hypothetical protein